MVVRKFEAPTLEQALAMVKQAMGPDALILSTSQKRSKWFQKPVLEVAAALPAKKEEHFDEDRLADIFPHRKIDIGESDDSSPEDGHSTAPSASTSKGGTQAQAARNSYGARGAVFHASRVEGAQAKPQKPTQNSTKTERYFEELGFSTSTSRDFVRRIMLEFSHGDRNDEKFMDRERVKLVSAGVKTLSEDILSRRKSWVLVGNPGVGKTATCVKLALHLKAKNISTSLVSADRRKLVGETELASYARMIGVPFSSVFQEKRDKVGIEIIDTPAMGFVQQELATALERICREASVILVLDAGQRLSELERTVADSETLAPVGVFFTRLDVVQGAGVVHDLLKAAKLPLLGMSVGAGFRESLKFCEPADLAKTILRIDSSRTDRNSLLGSATT